MKEGKIGFLPGPFRGVPKLYIPAKRICSLIIFAHNALNRLIDGVGNAKVHLVSGLTKSFKRQDGTQRNEKTQKAILDGGSAIAVLCKPFQEMFHYFPLIQISTVN